MNIVYWNKLNSSDIKQALKRPSENSTQSISEQVRAIMQQVKETGDDALKNFTAQFDKVNLEELCVQQVEFEQARLTLDAQKRNAISFAIARITDYHQAQLPENWQFDSMDGVICQRQARPIQAVGLYVPGGSAPLVSTVIMLAVPAMIAGCQQRIICTPPNSEGKIDPAILVAAQMCGIQQVYKVGGAQAIAAMSYGTHTIPKVDKIFGPGNKWVTAAKIESAISCKGLSIDMPAGPSEILIIADSNANPRFVAADLLSQAEHDMASQVMLITPCEMLAQKVSVLLTQMVEQLPRRDIAIAALANSKIIIVDNINAAIEISNVYSPEHLSLQVNNPRQYISSIQNVGTVFLGKWAAESLGDYVTGANHVLPTAGYARTLSGLSVLDFIKFIGIQEVTSRGLLKVGHYAQRLAQMEQLEAHKMAVDIRMQEIKQNG